MQHTTTISLRAPHVLLCLTILFAVSRASGSAETYKIVMHADRNMTAVTRAELSDMFLGHTAAWSDGTRIVLVDQIATSQVRQDFSREVHGRSAAAIRSYWLQVMYSGRGVPPVEKKTDEEVLAYVATHPGAIGYVTSAASTGALQLLKVSP